ncbi:DUF4303 domain-containing protein [Flammeovirga sp. EKP202]|uniref:DUF4303 domain-containing protein n=1 Tax=Flammeovirga sp. EKP202 TaxID=2770592 RepID=UPI00165F10AA|nr:DUF4303 domain-containing protein [Flammeovirga sp. EKP202]MBD0405314.1 DUF4303 domain-containing protein [Flammeovirga sp. EKP202]
MDKDIFLKELKTSLIDHYHSIDKSESLLSFGIYTDGDARSISIYFNTQENLEKGIRDDRDLDLEFQEIDEYFLFTMEEWKKDISFTLNDDRLNRLNEQVYQFGEFESERENEHHKDEIFDLFTQALIELRTEGIFQNEDTDFFLHLDVSDSWIDNKMFKRISNILPNGRNQSYKVFAESVNSI